MDGTTFDKSGPAGKETKPCPECAEDIMLDAVVCRFCQFDFRLGRNRKTAAGARDLPMEAHLRAIAIWYRIFAVLSLVGIFLIAIPMFSFSSGTEDMVGSGAVVGVGLGVCVLSYLIGAFLARYSNLARIVAGILAILNAVGTTIQVFATHLSLLLIGGPYVLWQLAVVWALFNRRSAFICSEEYRETIQLTPHLAPPTAGSPFFWVPMVLVVLCAGVTAIFVMGVGALISS